MIHYLVTRAHAYTIQTFLETWQRHLLARISVEFYEDLPYRRRVPAGAYIFSDLERLTDPQLELAQSFFSQLSAANCRILNQPAKVFRRYDLLKLMTDSGINRFRAYRATEPHANLTFPVFIRQENEHTGSLTELLQSEAELSAALRKLITEGHDAAHLLFVEYCHTADETGAFRKYSAMNIAGNLIPRHVLFSSEWVDKTPDLVDMQKVGEEAAYLKLNPHEADLRNIFAMAHVDYGRIDYAICNGKLTVWEINTNPVIVPAPGTCAPDRLPGQARSAQRIGEALAALDTVTAGNVPIRFPRQLLARLGASRGKRAAIAAARRVKRLKNVPQLRTLVEKLRRI